MISIRPDQVRRWVEDNFSKVKVYKNGQELAVCNPFDNDTGFHLWISTAKAVCHDWRPGHEFEGGKGGISLIRFVQKLKKVGFRDALQDICGTDIDPKQLYLSRKRKAEEEEEDEVEIEDKLELPEGAVPFDVDKSYRAVALKYVEGRALSEDIALSYRLHYTPDTIIFPYYEYGSLVYWQSRAFMAKSYYFPPEVGGVSKSKVLFGFDQVEIGSDLYMTEGPTDAMTLGLDTTAMGGAALTEDQVKKIRLLAPKRIIWALDNDKAGLAGLRRNFFMLRKKLPNVEQCYVIPPLEHEGEDVKDWNKLAQVSSLQYTRTYARRNTAILDIKAVASLVARRKFKL